MSRVLLNILLFFLRREVSTCCRRDSIIFDFYDRAWVCSNRKCHRFNRRFFENSRLSGELQNHNGRTLMSLAEVIQVYAIYHTTEIGVIGIRYMRSLVTLKIRTIVVVVHGREENKTRAACVCL